VRTDDPGAEEHTVGLRDVRAGALGVLAVTFTIAALHWAEALCVPLLLSVLLAYALEPFVKTLMRTRLPRPAAAIVVYVAIAVGAAASARLVRDKTRGFLDDLPRAIAAAKREVTASTAPRPLRQLQAAAGDLEKTLDSATAPAETEASKVIDVGRALDVRPYVLAVGITASSAGLRVTVVLVVTFVLLLTGDLYKRKFVDLAGARRGDRRLTIEVIETIDRQIERFLLARILISVIVGAATGVGEHLVGLDHAFVWGVVAGALNVLPFVGPTVAVALIAIAAFLQFHALEPSAVAGAVALAVAALEGNLITPWLTGRAGELNTVAVFVSVLFWGWVWDVWGLLLAVPIMMAVKAAADHIEPLQPVGELLGR
jgi:predicted PurR-regulated permease PerM